MLLGSTSEDQVYYILSPIIVRYNIANNAISKSFSLQLASIGLDESDFTYLKAPH